MVVTAFSTASEGAGHLAPGAHTGEAHAKKVAKASAAIMLRSSSALEEEEQQRGHGAASAAAPKPPAPALAVGSPVAVTALAAAVDTTSLQSSTPTLQLGAPSVHSSTPSSTPPGDAGSSTPHSDGRCATPGAASSSGGAPLSHGHGSAADLAAAAAAAQERQAAARRATGAAVDIPSVVERLKQRPLSGQVVAWGWAAAASLSAVRRTMPAQLFAALWPATEACACRMMPQDVLEMMESWLCLMQQCPRHFRLSREVLEPLTSYALPAAVKRMGEEQLAALAVLARDIAMHRSDADMQPMGARHSCASARDLMQPVFALAAAETAWRCSNPARYVSPETVSAVITAAPAWSWRVFQHRDSPALQAIKMATAAALEELRPHSPRDLPRGAFGKLKTGGSGPLSPRAARAAAAAQQQQRRRPQE